MKYQFDLALAEEYGLGEAIIIELYHTISVKQATHEENIWDGRTWIKSTIKGMTKIMPFYSVKQIKTRLQNLVERGVLLRDQKSENVFDKSNWYTFTDDFIARHLHPLTVPEYEPESTETEAGDTRSDTFVTSNIPQGPFDGPSGATRRDPQGPCIYNNILYNNTNTGIRVDTGKMVESDENKISNTHTLVAKGKKENPEGPRRRAESIPPTAEEVKDYATSKGYPNYAAPFLDHYEMVGWVYGKSKHKIKDWKAAYRRWVSTEKTGIGQAAPVITSNRKLADFR